MKKLTERQALLFAFIASCVSLLATLGIAFAFGTALSGKQSQLTESRNFSGDTVIQGRRVFIKHCVECHGLDARGDEGSNLHNLGAGDALMQQNNHGRHQRRDARLRKSAQRGRCARIDSLPAHAQELNVILCVRTE